MKKLFDTSDPGELAQFAFEQLPADYVEHIERLAKMDAEGAFRSAHYDHSLLFMTYLTNLCRKWYARGRKLGFEEGQTYEQENGEGGGEPTPWGDLD